MFVGQKEETTECKSKGAKGNAFLKSWGITLSLSVVLWAVFLLLFSYVGVEKCNPAVVVSFFVNGIIFYGMLVFSLKKRAFSLDMIHAFFLFTFMFFAPFVQYLKGAWCWGTTFSDDRILITNLLLDCWAFVYVLMRKVRFFPRKKKTSRLPPSDKPRANIRVNRTFLILCVILSNIIALYLFTKHGASLFSRATNQAFIFSSTTLTLLVSSVVPAFVTGTTALAVFNVSPRGRLIDWILLIMQTLALLVVCFPMGVERYKMAVIYIGLALILCPFFREGGWFLLLMIFGLTVVFPALDAFRESSFAELNIFEVLQKVISFGPNSLAQDHYDAYTMFMLVQEYVADNGLSYGNQLLGVLLFFVPRSLWQNKPLGSGQTAAEFYNWKFTNLSCPLPAEGFVNFGVIGVILFAVILAKVSNKLDDRFWKGRSAALKLLYPFLIPYLFFMLRGDLLSSFAYIVGFSVTVLFLYFVNGAFNFIAFKRKKNRNIKLSSGRKI